MIVTDSDISSNLKYHLSPQETGRQVSQSISERGLVATTSLPASDTVSVANDVLAPEVVNEAAKNYVAAGLSIIPIDGVSGSKAPEGSLLPQHWDVSRKRYDCSWINFQCRRPTPEELMKWFGGDRPVGLAVIAGEVSGGGGGGCGLEIIDFDTAELADPWLERVKSRAPGLVERLVRIRTPRPGLHVYYRCAKFGRNQKLAFDVKQVENDVRRRKVLIETRGEGGYCISPPSPRGCHPTGRRYELADGSPALTMIPTISSEEREILLAEARAFNRYQPRKRVTRSSGNRINLLSGILPGDDFDRRAGWFDILGAHGWQFVEQTGEMQYWRRPGKANGVSATVNYEGRDLFHVFSSNAYPFEEGTSYNKFQAYTLLNHGGDYHKAAQTLRRQGYGT